MQKFLLTRGFESLRRLKCEQVAK